MFYAAICHHVHSPFYRKIVLLLIACCVSLKKILDHLFMVYSIYMYLCGCCFQTIIGGVATCRDFGLYMQAGYFMAYYFPPGANCTSGLQAGTYDMSKWYLLAVTSNGTHLTVYVNSVQQSQTQVIKMKSFTLLLLSVSSN